MTDRRHNNPNHCLSLANELREANQRIKELESDFAKQLEANQEVELAQSRKINKLKATLRAIRNQTNSTLQATDGPITIWED